MKEKNEVLFCSMPIPKAILVLAVPTVISQIITIIYNMADTFFIGQLGEPRQVAAATLNMPLFMFMTALSNLFGVGGSSLISRFLGANEHKKSISLLRILYLDNHCICLFIWYFYAPVPSCPYASSWRK